MSEARKFDKTMRIDIDPAAIDKKSVDIGQRQVRPGAGRTWRTQYVKRDTPFYKLLESVYDAVLITSRSGRIIECNERACDFFRVPSKGLIGLEVITLISGATESLIETINKNLVSRKYTLVEAHCKRFNGTSFAAEIAVNLVSLDVHGQLCFFVRDITLRQQERQELQAAMERLQDHDRRRMEFVSNVSHELRTPLTSMIYAVGNMLRGVAGPMPEKALNYLDRLKSDCQRLLATVNDILDLRQIETQELILTKIVAPLGQIVRDGAETLQVQADSKSILLNFELGERELFCWCDAQKLERVVLNIVGNAVKFTPINGSISITLKQHPQYPKKALLTVSDTGMGIPSEVLPKISQRYFRVGEHVSGSGLGLAIAREIIELHGGSMSFASPVPGTKCGTAVSLELPLAPKLLVVAISQDAETAQYLKSKMSDRGYAVHVTAVAHEAMDMCRSKLPAVMVLDRRLEGVDVRELILQLRENAKTKRLPIIVLGVQVVERQEMELYRHFGIFYFSLPWREKDIARSLAMAVLGKLR